MDYFIYFLQIKDACKDLVLSDEQLRMLMTSLTHEIKRGLSKETHEEAIVRCYTTYVQDLPNGTGNKLLNLIIFNVFKIFNDF